MCKNIQLLLKRQCVGEGGWGFYAQCFFGFFYLHLFHLTMSEETFLHQRGWLYITFFQGLHGTPVHGCAILCLYSIPIDRHFKFLLFFVFTNSVTRNTVYKDNYKDIFGHMSEYMYKINLLQWNFLVKKYAHL